MPLKTFQSCNYPGPEFLAVKLCRADQRSSRVSDVTDAASPDPSVRLDLAKKIRDACINVGFFYGEPIRIRDTTFPPIVRCLA